MGRKKNSETGFPGSIAKGLIISLSIILTICLIPALLSLSFNQTIFKSNFYAGVLKRTNFYEQVPTLIADTVMSTGSSTMQGGLLSGMDQSQFRWVVESIIPPGWIETQTNAAMASVLDFLNFKTESLKIVIDLQPIKDYLSGNDGKQSLVSLLASLPECNEDQLTQIMIAMQSGQGGFALCHPPSSDLFNMDTMLDPVIDSFAASLPSVIEIKNDNPQGVIQRIINSPIINIYRKFRIILPIFPWVCLVLALCIILLSRRSLQWMVSGLGVPLVFASLLCAIPGVWLFLTGGRGLNGVAPDASFSSMQGFDGLLGGVIQEGFKTAGQGVLVWCVGALACGLILISINIVTKK